MAELIAECALGDRKAFAELYDRTSSRVFGLVLRVLRDKGFAEETTQEVYLQVWRNAGRFDPEKGPVLSWLTMLAHARAVDRVRAERSHSDREGVYNSLQLIPSFDDVTEEVERRLEHRYVVECLDNLTATQRESILLAYYDGRSYREVAAYLGVSLPTIKSRIRDGLARLRGGLEAEMA